MNIDKRTSTGQTMTILEQTGENRSESVNKRLRYRGPVCDHPNFRTWVFALKTSYTCCACYVRPRYVADRLTKVINLIEDSILWVQKTGSETGPPLILLPVSKWTSNSDSSYQKTYTTRKLGLELHFKDIFRRFSWFYHCAGAETPLILLPVSKWTSNSDSSYRKTYTTRKLGLKTAF